MFSTRKEFLDSNTDERWLSSAKISDVDFESTENFREGSEHCKLDESGLVELAIPL